MSAIGDERTTIKHRDFGAFDPIRKWSVHHSSRGTIAKQIGAASDFQVDPGQLSSDPPLVAKKTVSRF